jgi:hypothetical protein
MQKRLLWLYRLFEAGMSLCGSGKSERITTENTGSTEGFLLAGGCCLRALLKV